MNRLFTLLLLAVASLLSLTVSCGSNRNSEVLVEDAIRYHLATRTDLSMKNMQVRLDQVDFQGDRATAEVTIQARDDERARMQMTYALRWTGSGWQVERPSSGSVGGAHGGAEAQTGEPGAGSGLPPGHPQIGEGGSPRSELPADRPPIGEQPGGASPELPEGHPPVPQQ